MSYNRPTANQVNLGSTNLDQVINSTGVWIGSPTGLQGATGAQGSSGSNGSQGATGSQGTQGATGAQGTQGVQGRQGPQGTTGSQGATGATGSQGATGATGAQGTTGSQGTQGVQGPGGLTTTDATTLAGLTVPQFYNNMGNNHSTYADFNNVPNFGFYFLQGNTNGPSGAGQFYGMTLGLGNEYPFTSYACQFAIPRMPVSGTTPYLSFRFRENGTWGSWYKAAAGYADSAGDASTLGGVGAADYTREDLTGLGKTGAVGLDSVTDTAAEWSALPVGYARMISSSIGTAGGAPLNNYGYFIKVANRDTSGGWGGLWCGYSAGENYIGRTASDASFASWDKLWSDANLGTTASFQIGSFGVGTAASGTSGEIRATNNITAYYSDMRLKVHLGDIPYALDKVMSLSGFYFEPNETAQALGYEKIKQVGVSAQEVEAVLPEAVAPAPISDEYLTVRYEKLVPLLIEAIKELKREVDDLKEQINARSNLS